MTQRRKKPPLKRAALAGTALLAAAALWQGLTVRKYVLETDKLTAPVRLALLSDFHGARYGQGQSRLLAAVDRLEPDAVVMPGDFYDENHTDGSADADACTDSGTHTDPGTYAGS